MGGAYDYTLTLFTNDTNCYLQQPLPTHDERFTCFQDALTERPRNTPRLGAFWRPDPTDQEHRAELVVRPDRVLKLTKNFRRHQLSSDQNLVTFHCTWLVGILIMVCRNPHITGPYFIPKKHPKQLNDQGFGSLLIVMTFFWKNGCEL